MTDRELLEAAAKAAGYWDAKFGVPDKLPRPDWNPLADEGDALRLAVTLRIDIAYPPKSGNVIACKGAIGARESVDYVDDPNEATRRAIVRAAAAMAQQEPKA